MLIECALGFRVHAVQCAAVPWSTISSYIVDEGGHNFLAPPAGAPKYTAGVDFGGSKPTRGGNARGSVQL